MTVWDESALKVAEFLLQIKSIKLSPDKPFTWSKGWKSPIYCDNRLTLSYPGIRTFIRQQISEVIDEVYGKPDVIAGVATGGVAVGALVAQELGLPFIYIRSSSKGHGLQNQVEGVLNEGQSVVVIEDLVSTGGSSLDAVEAIRAKGAVVKGMVAIFTYGFPQAANAFKAAKCDLVTLSDYDHLIEQAMAEGYVQEGQSEKLKQWRKDPEKWGELL